MLCSWEKKKNSNNYNYNIVVVFVAVVVVALPSTVRGQVDEANPCVWKSTVTKKTYDFSALTLTKEGEQWTAEDEEYEYVFNICANNLGPLCDSYYAVYQIWAGGYCHFLASAYTSNWGHINPDDPGYGVMASYVGGGETCGSNPRVVYFYFICDKKREIPDRSKPLNATEYGTCSHIIEIPTSLACKNGGGGGGGDGGSDDGISGGTIFLLVFFLGGGAYLAAGSYYKYAVLGKSGTEMIPHIDFFKALPSMVWDGLVFAFTGCPSRQTSITAPGSGTGYQSINK